MQFMHTSLTFREQKDKLQNVETQNRHLEDVETQNIHKFKFSNPLRQTTNDVEILWALHSIEVPSKISPA